MTPQPGSQGRNGRLTPLSSWKWGPLALGLHLLSPKPLTASITGCICPHRRESLRNPTSSPQASLWPGFTP